MSRNPNRDPGHLTPRERQALALCDCVDGMSVPDLMQLMRVTYQTASEFVTDLACLGRVTRVKAPGVIYLRNFADPLHAQAWLEGHLVVARLAGEKVAAAAARKAAIRAAAEEGRQKNKAIKAIKPAAKKTARKPPAALQRAAVATNPSSVTPTVYVTPIDTRFRVDAVDAFRGEFAGLPGTDPITGKPWEALGLSVYERRRA